MYRFVLRPRWILSHVFVLVVILACLNLGAWQLRRHDERAARNATVEARSELPASPVTELLGSTGDVGELRYRTGTAEGRYTDRVLLVDNRSKDGLPGSWVLSPLVLDDGSVLVVNRGFHGAGPGAVDPPAPPSGDVSVEGTLTPWQGSCGVRGDEGGAPVGMACLNREGAEEAFGTEVLPVVLQRTRSAPPAPAVLSSVPLPELDSGPHRGYAAQWFIFGTIALVGYPLILRRVARDRAAGGAAPPDPDGPTPEGHRPRADAPVG